MKLKHKRLMSVAFFVIFAAIFIVGALSPEVDVVLKKATNICLECIGIGG